jgi:acyl-CoA synthetase (NDP forming)
MMVSETNETIQNMTRLFYPRAIAIVGASTKPTKWGSRITLNLLNGGYEGNIYPVNPNEGEVFGLKVYANIRAVPEDTELAVIAVPRDLVCEVLLGCGSKGIKANVIITAGFAELDELGSKIQQEITNIADRFHLTVVGPNCTGVSCPVSKLYSTMVLLFPKAGNMSIIVQSGNVGNSLLTRSISHNLGVSKYASIGNQAVCNVGSFLEYFRTDSDTKVIGAYIEGFKNNDTATDFIEAARKVAFRKPLIVLKGGQTEVGAKAAKSHTGSLGGSAQIFSGLCRQIGVIEAQSIEELFYTMAAFSTQPHIRGKKVGIIAWGGGHGVIAADACIRSGLEVMELPPRIIKKLSSYLPAWWSHQNPVDLAGGIGGNILEKVIEVLGAWNGIDALVLLLGIERFWRRSLPLGDVGHRDKIDYSYYYRLIGEIARQTGLNEKAIIRIKQISAKYQKPILCCAELPGVLEYGRQTNLGDDIFYFPAPEIAINAISNMTKYKDSRRK